MTERALAGSRIRERRIAKGLKQAELAADVGISASYLNLIEHNRRRIGGKLLQSIAHRLAVEPSLLSEGAERAVVARLNWVAGRFGGDGDVAAAADFPARFPGWANLAIHAARRVEELERSVETLTDRLAHDPHLAATLHEVLSTVTAIRSTASILSDTREIEPEWRDRFHRNINEDATRLAEGAQALVGFLDGVGDAHSDISSPQEEFAAFLMSYNWHFPALEQGHNKAADSYLKGALQLKSTSAHAIAARYLERYADDVEKLPLQAFKSAYRDHGADPLALAATFGVDAACVLRRIATLPDVGAGLVVCDASGTMVFRKPVEDFHIPRFGAACPLWPLFRTLSRPLVTFADSVSQPARGGGGQENAFQTYAVAQPVPSSAYGREPLMEATMLILPQGKDEHPVDTHPIGGSCRVCPRNGCRARREPSIMSVGF